MPNLSNKSSTDPLFPPCTNLPILISFCIFCTLNYFFSLKNNVENVKEYQTPICRYVLADKYIKPKTLVFQYVV